MIGVEKKTLLDERTLVDEEHRRVDAARLRGAGAGAALAVAALGVFVVTLDALVVNVALPSFGHDLGGSITGLQWVIDGYTLMFAALLLSAGALADRIGARRAFGVGLVTFVVASAACGLAPGIGALVAARLVQGAGAAVMMPATLALIRETYHDGARRARAIALWSLGASAASAAGPVVGGFLILLSWRAIFFINLPVGVVALVLFARVPRSPRRAVPFDWPGQATAVLGMGTLTYGLIEGGADSFTAPRVMVALAVAVVALTAFLVVEARGAHPMLPLELFRSRPVTVSVVGGFTFTVGFYGLVFLYSLYLQQLRGLSPLATGLTFVPMTALTAVVTLLAPRIAARFGPRVPIAAGQALIAAGLLSLCVAAAEGVPIWLLATLSILVGFGGALAVPTITALLLGSVPAERAGTASGTLTMFRQVGGALAVAVFGALVAHRETFLQGLEVSLVIAALLLLVTAMASLSLKVHHVSVTAQTLYDHM
ncbi:MAG TPA: MFS transporter [Ktedonobacterales bacterium]|nr:MFS transporter [Ktedonobacterales bacterium]